MIQFECSVILYIMDKYCMNLFTRIDLIFYDIVNSLIMIEKYCGVDCTKAGKRYSLDSGFFNRSNFGRCSI